MQRKIVHFFKNWCWWDPWNGGVPLVPQFVFPCFCKSLLHKRKTNWVLPTVNNLNKVFYDVKKSNTLNLSRVANNGYSVGHSTSLQPIWNLILLHRVLGRRFQGSLWSQF